MGFFKFATPISTLGNKKRNLNKPQKHIVESIVASICGASIPAILFLFIDLILKGHLQKPLNTQTQKNISSGIFLETTKLNRLL